MKAKSKKIYFSKEKKYIQYIYPNKNSMHISKKGFTLMEMMIVLAVLAILFAALTPFAQVYLARARDTTRITDLDTIHKALVAYENDNGKMPLTFTKPPKEFMASTVDFIPDVSAAGMCPMIGIMCGV